MLMNSVYLSNNPTGGGGKKKVKSISFVSAFCCEQYVARKGAKEKDLIIAEVFFPTKAPCSWGHA